MDLRGRTSTGPLREFNERQVSLGGDKPQTWEWAEILRLEFGHERELTSRGGPTVFTARGDSLVAAPVEMNEEELIVGWTHFRDWPSVRIPLEMVRGALLDSPKTAPERLRLFHAVFHRADRSDALFLRNGDELAGELAGLEGAEFTLATAAGSMRAKTSDVSALVMNPDLVVQPEPAEVHRLLISLSDGSHLTAQSWNRTDKPALRITTMFGAELDLPWTAISSIRVLGGGAEYLSDLEPEKYEFTPYLSGTWPLSRDRSLIGGALQLGGRTFPKGIALHSRSRVTYQLAGDYRWFHATLGIDAETGGEGNAEVRVIVDEKEVFRGDTITGRQPPHVLQPLNITGAQRLTIIVDYGELGDVQDHVDFAEAVLVR